MNSQTKEEITTVENIVPASVVRKTTTQTDPLIKEEAPQKVFQNKSNHLVLLGIY